MGLFDQLNDKQIEAVKETEGYVRVIAGAGSGKTKLLVSRYAYLVEEYGIDPANILCVTFTNKAAGEMKKRIRALIGGSCDTSLICTYHGFCARVLRENPEKLFFSKGFQILDTPGQKAILEEIYQKRELKLDHASFESFLKKLNEIKKNTEYVPPFCNPKPCRILTTNEDKNGILEEYLQRQKAIYSLDFNDLINFTLYLFDTDQEVREKWQNKLNYIQVDEFQDSSAREMALIDTLSAKYRNLMIVGDPDQNIYEWRGSNVKLLVEFDKTHTGTKTIFLNQNYRSTPEILLCANRLIEKNIFRLKKDLFTLSNAGAQVVHYHSKSDEEENKTIVSCIKQLMKTNEYTYSDFAILYRSGFLSRVVEKKLVENGIPYEIYGGVKFYQRMEIQDVIAYLRLLAYDDDLSFKRIINTPRRRFGRAKMQRLERIKENGYSMFYQENESSLFNVLKYNLSDPMLGASDVAPFLELIDSLRKDMGSMRISEIVNRVLEGSGYECYIRELGDEERLENLSEFKRIANEFERSFGENLTLPEFLEQIALQSGEDEEKPRDAVKLMTIHAAKGLEFPVVFLVGLSEGIFPSSKTIEERKDLGLEEERRLCYVAITRAQAYLFIMDSEGMSEKGVKKLPSRFLGEIGTNNYLRIGEISKDLQQEASAYIRKLTPDTSTKSDFAVGDIVKHHAFGEGVILSIDTKKGAYEILFDKLDQPRTISKHFFDKSDHTSPLPTPVPHPALIAENAIKAVPPEKNIETGDHNCAATQGISTTPNNGVTDSSESRLSPIVPSTPPQIIPDESKGSIPERTKGIAPGEVLEKESSEKVYTREPSAPPINGKVLQPSLPRPEDLWKREDVPHLGWHCTGVSDLGSPAGICQMCGYHIIRYVHHMVHPDHSPLDVGCVCAGRMEGDVEGAKQRERDFKNKQKRYISFKERPCRMSKNGNLYSKMKGHLIVYYKVASSTLWKFSIDGVFDPRRFGSRDEASNAAFEALDRLVNS